MGQICRSEDYDSLLVPPVKPLYLNVGGLRRSMLVEKVIPSDASRIGHLDRAVRQMVQFLLKTSGSGLHESLPFLPVEGNKLALQNLHHLTNDFYPEVPLRESLEVRSIIDKTNSLLASLHEEGLIEIALDELQTLRPTCLLSAQYYSSEQANEIRMSHIQQAKEFRLQQIRHPERHAQPPEQIIPPNILRISPDELNLDLRLRDYAVIQQDGVYSDGICRIITLGEVAQAIIHRINQKLQADPTNAKITLTPEDMLIGEKLPLGRWSQHYQYNMLQGLGYRTWPDPREEPPYWIALVLQSLKNKGLITNFTLPRYESPELHVNLSRVRQGLSDRIEGENTERSGILPMLVG